MRRLDAPIVRVTVAFTALTVVMTWPLAAGLTRDVPGDLGDSLLNLWILGWGAEHWPRVAAGQMSRVDLWNANIFHPEPLSLAFSEHLFGQVLQILPIYWLSGNLILAYNLLFLSSFVLSGLGMYLLVREWLGADRSSICWPAMIAGLIYAFVPYRIAQVAHIQSVSSQWMPFALYGFVRFIRGRDRPLATGKARSFRAVLTGLSPLGIGTAALLLQNWSCGYYLIYFAPFVVLVVVHQIVAAGRAGDWRLWGAFAMSAFVVVAGTWPLLTLYLDAQRIYGFARPLDEVIRFSADIYSYATAPDALRLWGSRLQAYPKPEGALFFGVMPWLLVLVSAGFLVRPTPQVPTSPSSSTRRVFRGVLLIVMLVQLAGLIGIVLTGGFVTSVAGVPIRATNAPRILTAVVLVGALWLVTDRTARARARRVIASPLGLTLFLVFLAIGLSLGPHPRSMGRPLDGLGLYGPLYDHVPGFNGLRVPARYAMIAALFVAVAAGYGAFAVLRRRGRPSLGALAIGGAFLLEAAFVPMTVNATWGDGAVQPPPRIQPASHAPPVYHALAGLEDTAVVAEFPFGDAAWELRYVYYSTVHWKRLVNGYSGSFPRNYVVRVSLLSRVADQPDAAWQALADAGTTHVVVHDAAMPADLAAVIHRWLRSNHARVLERFDTDVLYELPPPPRNR